MKKMKFLSLMSAALMAGTMTLSSCSKEETETPVDTDKSVVTVSGTLTGNVTWSSDTIYKLQGYVRVGEDLTAGGAPTKTGTLTIQPGTVIIGDRASKGTLIVQRGSKIYAEGTAAKPIVFTSERGVGLRAPGDWGGVVICGKATNNLPGGTGELEGGYGAFHGGTNDDDTSGVLKFIRIEFAGIAINPNQEVNSITFGSVGRGTVVENIQCSFGGDDAFEWFGGTVNCKNLIAYRCQDDDLDVDNGFRGNVQFVVSIKDPNIADQSGSNGFEVDNDGTGSSNTPVTAPTFSNVSLFGPKGNREVNISLQYQNAMQLRRNSKIKIHNAFVTGYPNGIFIDGSTTQANATAGDLVIKNTVLAGVENWGGNGFGSAGTVFVNATVGIDSSVSPWIGKQHATNPRGAAFLPASGFDTQTWFNTAGFGNSFVSKYQDAGVSASSFDFAALSLLPSAGSSLLSGASFTGLTGFESVAFKGAFGATDWTSGWAEWNPSVKVY